MMQRQRSKMKLVAMMQREAMKYNVAWGAFTTLAPALTEDWGTLLLLGVNSVSTRQSRAHTTNDPQWPCHAIWEVPDQWEVNNGPSSGPVIIMVKNSRCYILVLKNLLKIVKISFDINWQQYINLLCIQNVSWYILTSVLHELNVFVYFLPQTLLLIFNVFKVSMFLFMISS